MTDIYALEQLIRRWYERSYSDFVRMDDPFDRFVCLWIAFNAWGSHVTNTETEDRKMVDRLKADRRLAEAFARCGEEPAFRSELAKLKGVPIPTHRNNPRERLLRDERSLPQLLDVIYQVRCNLFHGRKDPADARELELVNRASVIMGNLLEKLIVRHDLMMVSGRLRDRGLTTSSM